MSNATETHPHVLLETARDVEALSSNAPFVLNVDAVHVVRSGHVDVFAVRMREGRALSRRRHLMRVREGELLVSTREVDGGLRDEFHLLAVGSPGAEISRVDDVDRLSWDDAFAEAFAAGLDRWLDEVAQGTLPSMTPKEHALPDENQMIEPDAILRSPSGIRWIHLDEGRLQWMSRSRLPEVEAGEGPVPIGPSLWHRTLEVCTVRTASTLDRIRAETWRDDVARVHDYVRATISTAALHESVVERKRLERRAEATSSAMEEACGKLASIMSRGEVVTAATDPLLDACRRVGDSIGVEIRPPLASSAASRGDRLKEIAKASRIRTRKVALRGDWWTQDAGPMLAMRERPDSGDRAPVALLPKGESAYELYDPATGRTTLVDEAAADALYPFAYSFYRPFPARALSAWDVFRFGIAECRSDMWTVLLAGLAGGILGMVTPVVTGVIFNTIIPESEQGQLAQIVFILVACALATGVFQFVRGLAVLRVESKMDASVQSAVWDRLLNLPTSFFRRFTAGELAVRAGGISTIRQLLSGATVSSILSGLFSVFQLGLLFYYDANLAMWAIGLTIAALGITFSGSYLQLLHQRRVTELQSKLSGRVLQFITGITKLRVAGAEKKAFALWADQFSEQRSLQVRARRIGNAMQVFNTVFPVLSLMVIFAVMISRDDLAMATGDFIAFNAALGTFTTQMLSMTGAFAAIQMAIPVYEQARPILETTPEIDDTKRDPGVLDGAVDVRHVSFRYDEDGPLVLENVTITAEPGEFIALVGPSGSGKSTVLRLLLGFEHPEAGNLYLSGQDLDGLDIQAVRRQIGVVLQNGRLMSGDLFTNITGSSNATLDDAWEAARMAGLDDDIKSMPMGMHTVVSEGGSTLSGGQRQRLLVARALINRPRLLFFDEATSALDNRTQAIVSESLDRMQATRIVVAHRLSTIANADRIYVLERGRVVQAGTYDELAAADGTFQDLIKRQTL